MTEDELKIGGNRRQVSERTKDSVKVHVFDTTEADPGFVDWRKKGAVTPVGNQLNCLSGFAFAAIGSIESDYFIKT